MSVLSLGTIFLVSSVMAVTTVGVVAAVSCALVLMQTEENVFSKDFNLDDFKRNLHNYRVQVAYLNDSLSRLRDVVDRTPVNVELQHAKQQIIDKLDRIISTLNRSVYSSASAVVYNPQAVPQTAPQRVSQTTLQAASQTASQTTPQTTPQTVSQVTSQTVSQGVSQTVSEVDFRAISSEVTEITKQFNELLIEDQLLTNKKSEIVNDLRALSNTSEEVAREVEKMISQVQDVKSVKVEVLQNMLDRAYQEYDKVSKVTNVVKLENVIAQRISDICREIENLDKEYFESIKNRYTDLSSKNEATLKLLLDQAKVDLARIKTTVTRDRIYKLQLKNHLSTLESFNKMLADDDQFRVTPMYSQLLKLISSCNDLLYQKYVAKEEFESFQVKFSDVLNSIQKFMEFRKFRDYVRDKLADVLNSLGYSLVDSEIMEKLVNGQVVYIDLPYEKDYKVQVKLEQDGKILFRLVKFVGSMDASEYEKMKDLEVAKKWCSDYDKILALLREHGIYMEDIKRIEPEEMEVTYIVKEEYAKKSSYQTAKQPEQRYMQLE